MEDHGVGQHDHCFERPEVRLRGPQRRSRLGEDLNRAKDVANNDQPHENVHCRDDYHHLAISGMLRLVPLLLSILEQSQYVDEDPIEEELEDQTGFDQGMSGGHGVVALAGTEVCCRAL